MDAVELLSRYARAAPSEQYYAASERVPIEGVVQKPSCASLLCPRGYVLCGKNMCYCWLCSDNRVGCRNRKGR